MNAIMQRRLDLLKWFGEIEGDARLKVMIGAQKLDDLLKDLLVKALDVGASNDVFDFRSALGTFSSRILLAKHLKLISKDYASFLVALKGLRNSIAHAVKQVDLSAAPFCDSLASMRGAIEGSEHFEFYSDRIDPDQSLSNLLDVCLIVTSLELEIAITVVKPFEMNYDLEIGILSSQ